MEATITNKLKIAAAGIALAASGFVLGTTGVSWAQGDGAAGDGETSSPAETAPAGADDRHAGGSHDRPADHTQP